ncbi:MAG: prepilin-type N-terminal cleavage/methylation domain-containing protein [Nitrospirae bacterium]|nr:prepilin-type N-terminal cleavage/methylation domain-containing protein [Candidatus Troglogloeales bacterium]
MIKQQSHQGVAGNASTKNGFTLIEILVSFSIVTIVMGLLYGTFRSTIKTAEKIDQDADAHRIARIVFYQLTKDLSMFNQSQGTGSSSTGSATPFGALRLIGENRSRFIDGSNYSDDTIAFVSLSAPPVLQGFSELDRAEIHYSLSEESLIREVKLRNKPIKNEVGESVLGLNFRYFDGKKREWADEWDPSLTNEMPLAMEVTLIVKAPFKEKTFKTTVGIPLAGSL